MAPPSPEEATTLTPPLFSLPPIAPHLHEQVEDPKVHVLLESMRQGANMVSLLLLPVEFFVMPTTYLLNLFPCRSPPAMMP